MTKSRSDYTAANRAAWDASAPYHREADGFARLRRAFETPGYSHLDALAAEELQSLGVIGADVAQLCCNNGREILSIKNIGARSCVGFDQSGAFLAQAHELAAARDIDCTFVETDIYAIGAEHDAAYDIVVITIGVLGWMPDLPAFVAIAARLLRPGGALFIYEEHPIMMMFEIYDTDDPYRLQYSYFKDEPFEDLGAILYDGGPRQPGPAHYWFVHKMSDIITSCLDNGLAIERFREFPHNISSAEFEIYNDQAAQLPQSYMLVARKPA